MVLEIITYAVILIAPPSSGDGPPPITDQAQPVLADRLSKTVLRIAGALLMALSDE